MRHIYIVCSNRMNSQETKSNTFEESNCFDCLWKVISDISLQNHHELVFKRIEELQKIVDYKSEFDVLLKD